MLTHVSAAWVTRQALETKSTLKPGDLSNTFNTMVIHNHPLPGLMTPQLVKKVPTVMIALDICQGQRMHPSDQSGSFPFGRRCEPLFRMV